MKGRIGSPQSLEVVTPLAQRTIEIKMADSFIKQIQRKYGESRFIDDLSGKAALFSGRVDP